MPSPEFVAAREAKVAEVKAELNAMPAPAAEADNESSSTTAVGPPADGNALGSGSASAAESEAKTAEGDAAPARKELASPRLAAAVRAETRAQRMRQQMQRERESFTAEMRREREAMAKEREAHSKEIADSRKLSSGDVLDVLRERKVDGKQIAKYIADGADPDAEVKRELAELRAWREAQEQEKRSAAEQAERARVEAADQRGEAMFIKFVDDAAVKYPALSKFPEKAIRAAARRAAASGEFQSFEDLASRLERDATEWWGEAEKRSAARQAQSGGGAQAQGQSDAGSGTQAGKPGNGTSTRVLTRDMNASTAPTSQREETRAERAARLKADIAARPPARAS